MLQGLCEIHYGGQFPNNFQSRSAIYVVPFQVIIAELHVANEFNLLFYIYLSFNSERLESLQKCFIVCGIYHLTDQPFR